MTLIIDAAFKYLEECMMWGKKIDVWWMKKRQCWLDVPMPLVFAVNRGGLAVYGDSNGKLWRADTHKPYKGFIKSLHYVMHPLDPYFPHHLAEYFMDREWLQPFPQFNRSFPLLTQEDIEFLNAQRPKNRLTNRISVFEGNYTVGLYPRSSEIVASGMDRVVKIAELLTMHESIEKRELHRLLVRWIQEKRDGR